MAAASPPPPPSIRCARPRPSMASTSAARASSGRAGRGARVSRVSPSGSPGPICPAGASPTLSAASPASRSARPCAGRRYDVVRVERSAASAPTPRPAPSASNQASVCRSSIRSSTSTRRTHQSPDGRPAPARAWSSRSSATPDSSRRTRAASDTQAVAVSRSTNSSVIRPSPVPPRRSRRVGCPRRAGRRRRRCRSGSGRSPPAASPRGGPRTPSGPGAARVPGRSRRTQMRREGVRAVQVENPLQHTALLVSAAAHTSLKRCAMTARGFGRGASIANRPRPPSTPTRR